MQILQEILGLVQRRLFLKRTAIKEDDVIYIAKDISKNNVPDLESKAVRIKELSEYIGSSGGGGGTGPQGPAGPPGADGAPGATGPTGPIGPAGPVGAAGLNFTGNFDPAVGYAVDDVVFEAGSSYVCVSATSAPGPNPAPPNADWTFLALQGLDGPQGPIGPIGPAGASLWTPIVPLTFAGAADTIDLSTGNTFTIDITGSTTISMSNLGVGDYIFIIDNTAAEIVTLQTGTNMYTNNSLQPVITGITLMKGTSDGTKIFITSLENMNIL